MTSEEFRTNPLLLRNQFERTGTFEIPLIRKNEVTLENLSLIGYDKISSGKKEQVVHFFLDDYKFESLWNNPEPRIEKLSAFRAVLSPQFSIYSEMPIAVQIHNTFRSRWCGAYLQSKGIKVVPSVVWGKRILSGFALMESKKVLSSLFLQSGSVMRKISLWPVIVSL